MNAWCSEGHSPSGRSKHRMQIIKNRKAGWVKKTAHGLGFEGVGAVGWGDAKGYSQQGREGLCRLRDRPGFVLQEIKGVLWAQITCGTYKWASKLMGLFPSFYFIHTTFIEHWFCAGIGLVAEHSNPSSSSHLDGRPNHVQITTLQWGKCLKSAKPFPKSCECPDAGISAQEQGICGFSWRITMSHIGIYTSVMNYLNILPATAGETKLLPIADSLFLSGSSSHLRGQEISPGQFSIAHGSSVAL